MKRLAARDFEDLLQVGGTSNLHVLALLTGRSYIVCATCF